MMRHKFVSEDGLYCNATIIVMGKATTCGRPAHNGIHNTDILLPAELKYIADLVAVDEGEHAPVGINWRHLPDKVRRINDDAANAE